MLIADNDMPGLHDMAEHLSAMGIHHISANNGQDALKLFREHQRHIQAVILKMRLLKLNGVETLRAIRQLEPDIPAILISRYNEAEGNRRLAEAEKAHFLLKPVRHEELQHMFDSITAQIAGDKS